MENRVEVLFSTGVISRQVADYVQSVHVQLQLAYSHKQAQVDMLITHLAMACQRSIEGRSVDALTDQAMMELHSDDAYAQAQALYQKMSAEAPCQLTVTEKEYVVLHICSLLKESS